MHVVSALSVISLMARQSVLSHLDDSRYSGPHSVSTGTLCGFPAIEVGSLGSRWSPEKEAAQLALVTIFGQLQVCAKSHGGVKDLAVGDICSRETHTLGNRTWL